MAKPGPKDLGGRPSVMTQTTLDNLREAFLLGCTDAEACCKADISMATLYNYQQDNPEYVEQKNKWKENPFVQARGAIIKGFLDKSGGDLALKYMERKKKDEFSLRQEVTGKDGTPVEVGVCMLPVRK